MAVQLPLSNVFSVHMVSCRLKRFGDNLLKSLGGGGGGLVEDKNEDSVIRAFLWGGGRVTKFWGGGCPTKGPPGNPGPNDEVFY